MTDFDSYDHLSEWIAELAGVWDTICTTYLVLEKSKLFIYNVCSYLSSVAVVYIVEVCINVDCSCAVKSSRGAGRSD